jgi:N-acetylglucosamine-6-phosphate deacetylase
LIRSDGLFDLQVNGFAGIDFNEPTITAERLDTALAAMLATGVTLCLPTLITGFEAQLRERMLALDAAVADSRLGPVMVPGYHIEGPFLNPGEGYRGCHPAEAMRDPDPALYRRLSERLSRPILLVTLAPERPGSVAAIRALRESGICVAMAHSDASISQVREAVDAGLSLSTHLGNGLPRTLHKTENALLGQLAEPGLAACFIADGHHLSPEALGAMLRIKGVERSILVTDAVLAAAAPSGRYRFAGMEVERDAAGVVRPPGASHLAGSSLELDAAVRNVVQWGLATPEQAIRMASANPRAALAVAARAHGVALPAGNDVWSDELRPVEATP